MVETASSTKKEAHHELKMRHARGSTALPRYSLVATRLRPVFERSLHKEPDPYTPSLVRTRVVSSQETANEPTMTRIVVCSVSASTIRTGRPETLGDEIGARLDSYQVAL